MIACGLIPVFYVFKAIIYEGGYNPVTWLIKAFKMMQETWPKDIRAALKLWIPVDFICFSVALHWRLPIRQVFSFLWTMYFSFMRGELKTKQ